MSNRFQLKALTHVQGQACPRRFFTLTEDYCRISRLGTTRFRELGPTWGESWRSCRRRFLAVFPLAGKFLGFDAAIALAGDVDFERGVIESITDGIGDDRIGDDLGPVIER